MATLQISAAMCECLRKRHNWSVSIRFNSQLRVWVTGSGRRRGEASRYIVPGPDSYRGA